MRNANVLTTLSALAVFGLAACGDAQPVSGGGGGGGSCTGCHGEASRKPSFPQGSADYQKYVTAAPPAAPSGRPSDVVGAHQAHVNPSPTASPLPLTGPLACNNCHNPFPPPGDHVNYPVDYPSVVVFGAIALAPAVSTDGQNPGTPKWNGVTTSAGIATPTCSSVYCHGSFQWFGNGEGGKDVFGNLTNTPNWDDTTGAFAACGSCHALPPTNHIVNSYIKAGDATTCAGCHPGTVAANGTIIVDPQTGASQHVNGEIDEGAHPDPNWPAPTGHGYAAMQAPGGLQYCTQCHNIPAPFESSIAGDPTSACNVCHASALAGAATTNWQQNCVFCHGAQSLVHSWTRPATTTDPLWAQVAPPVGPLGSSATTTLAVGAHQQHVGSLNALSQTFACWQCHPTYPTADGMPADVGHVNGLPTPVPLGGALATTGGVQGVWSAPTCSSTYCHGNFPATPQSVGGSTAGLTGGNNAQPKWNQVDGTFAQCTSCHGGSVTDATGHATAAPNDGQHAFHVGAGFACSACHLGYTGTTVNVALHVNGVRDAGGTSQITSWNPTTLQCSATCHGSDNPKVW